MSMGVGLQSELIIQPEGDFLFGVSRCNGNADMMSLDIYHAASPLVRGADYEVNDPDVKKEIVARLVMDATALRVVLHQLIVMASEFESQSEKGDAK